MRFALWLIGLFGVAATVALFAGSNPGTVTVFWPPYRVDLSLNLVLVLLFFAFLLVHLALRALAALFALPIAAERWRLQQQERAAHEAFLEAVTHLMSGRFVRAREAARAVVAAAAAPDVDDEPPGKQPASGLRAGLSHLLLAESAHALQDRATRDAQLPLALAADAGAAPRQALREAVMLRSARWALDDGDADLALKRMAALPPGAARRTQGLRLRLAALRRAGRAQPALEAARLLQRHGALPPAAGSDAVLGLALEAIAVARDPAQLQAVFGQFRPTERALPEVAIAAAVRLRSLKGDPRTVRQWLLPAWEQMVALRSSGWPLPERLRLAQALAPGIQAIQGIEATGFASAWQDRIEAAHQRDPRDPALQYLAGLVCLERGLWDKAEPLLREAAQATNHPAFQRSVWLALAQGFEQRGEPEPATTAYKRAATVGA
ncbi:MAG: heme biosynthesis HemY N-terminal domain-containing protein [Burkholderiales bacterium]